MVRVEEVEAWLCLGSILKTELRGLADGAVVGCNKKTGIKEH